MGVFAFGEFEADTDVFELRREGKAIEISARCFDILLYLIRHRERVVSKAELTEKVWQAQALSASAVPTAVLALRRTLGDNADSGRHIANLRGRGYRFVAEVVEQNSVRASSGGQSPAGAPSVASRSAFVGRGAELAAIEAAYTRARAKTPQVVLLSGDAGIGKTRTAEVFSERARDDGALVLVGRCREGEGAPAFWPWVQIVRAVCSDADCAVISTDFKRLAPILMQMVPEVADAFPDLAPAPALDAESARFRLFDAVTTLLRRAGAVRPLVVVLDDLHRGDLASLQLLAFVVREIRESHVLVIATYRDVEAQRDSRRLPTITELVRQEPTRAIQLRGLSSLEVEQFLSLSALSEKSRISLTEILHAQSGGNPFFLTQLVHVLEAEGGASALEDGRGVAVLLPDGLREAVSRQLDGLPPDTRHALRVAAAAGREFSAVVLAEVLGTSASRVAAALDPALNARMILASDRVGCFRFAHVLLRDSIYEETPTHERGVLHQRIGSALECLYRDDLDTNAAELAYHYYEALNELGPDPAVRFAVLAGEAASARLAYEDAARHYLAALRILEQAGPGNLTRRCELLLALGEAEMHAGERERGRRALSQAASLAKRCNSTELLTRAALLLAPGLFAVEVGVRDSLLEGLLEAALSALGPSDSPQRARVLARLAMALASSNEGARQEALIQDAVSVAARLGDPSSRAYALTAKHGLMWEPHLLADRIQLIDELGVLAARTADSDLVLMHMLLRITLHFTQGRIEEVDSAIDEYSRLAGALNRPVSLWYTTLFKAARALMRGDFIAAEKLAEEFLSIGQRVQDLNALHSFGVYSCLLRLAEGRASTLLEMVDNYVTRYPGTPAWKFCRAYLYLHAGRRSEAQAQYRRLVEQGKAGIPVNEQWASSACLLAELCAAFQDDQNADWLYDLLRPGENLHCVIGISTAVFGCLARRLGLLAMIGERWDEAERQFELALSLESRVDSPPALAQALYDYSTMLRRRNRSGDRAKARKLTSQGIEIASQLRMAQLGRQFRELAKR